MATKNGARSSRSRSSRSSNGSAADGSANGASASRSMAGGSTQDSSASIGLAEDDPGLADEPSAVEQGSNTTVNTAEVEGTMAEEKAITNGETQTAKSGKLELAKKPESNGKEETGLAVRSSSSEMEVAESFTSAGIRPIAASHLNVYATLLNNRPIMASSLQVVEYAIPGNRPVFASDLVVRDDLTLPGGRPIVASDPDLLQASLLMGGRPIASNDIDDSEMLMGFID